MRKALAAALCLVLLAASGTALAEKTVTLTFVGDCTLGGEDWLINREGSFHDYARKEGYTYFFEKMRDFFSEDDLTIINFEGVLKDDSRDAVNKTYCFRGRQTLPASCRCPASRPSIWTTTTRWITASGARPAPLRRSPARACTSLTS